MNMQMISNILLEIFYIIVGLLMLNTAIDTLKDKEHKTRIGTAIFWTILAIIFIAGAAIPPVVVGALLLVIGVLTASKQVNIGNLKMPNVDFAEMQAKKLKNKIFLPSIVIAVGSLVIAQFTSLSGTVAIGIASVAAVITTFLVLKAKPKHLVEDSNRMVQSVGSTSILPQLLAALGTVFTAAGVGDVISSGISNFIPEGNILAGVIAYCVGMAVFTMIMGNAFAAFSVITVGIGLPFVFAQGANVAIAGALALTAGYCGTLLTPMAANFNIMPAALLETKDKNVVMKCQSLFAIILLVIHIALMYFLAF
ncbi:DUF979 domain-containing protein [Clostridium perfringens]|uniref:DUF979 domain-containing protein n=1 Tax=Clostridium perfringens TaxID=1502 RepID=A0A133N614_CLOPF|nr:DUF979 domain-containing protein [Clostridium perfringens]EGT3599636.1 DUF979 domain-containing protein [Clostridium perfringens]KXA11708.1 hypothetical protein HMPREF3222_01676 [Clostridium perfringens]MBS5922481.1 DUF979 domain-containing protein [Clostridium perfringens]MCH1963058.1 DUF979 domain-containing protein [Clostridium perfringens]MDK0537311.1 DUF979 domain-containing protein [Clostridium perfringens]